MHVEEKGTKQKLHPPHSIPLQNEPASYQLSFSKIQGFHTGASMKCS